MKRFNALFITLLFSAISYGQDPVELIITGNLKKLQKLHEEGLDLNKIYEEPEEYVLPGEEAASGYLMQWAYGANKIEIFRYLFGASRELPNFKAQLSSCLTHAADNNDLELIDSLVAIGADVNSKCSICYGNYPIQMALLNGHKDAYNYLLKKGADIHVKNEQGGNLLYYAISGGLYDEFLDLQEKGLSVLDHGDSWNYFLFACEASDPRFIRYVWDAVKDEQWFSGPGSDWTGENLSLNPIFWAAAADSVQLVFLEEKGYDLAYQDEYGYNLLHYAAENGNLSVIHFCIDRGFNPKHSTKDDWDALELAVTSGCYECVELILSNYPKGTGALDRTEERIKASIRIAKQMKNKRILKLLKGY